MMGDTNHSFFRPLWRRLAIIAFCAAWSVFEFANGETTWGTMAAAMTVYGVWSFLIAYKPAPDAPAADTSDAGKE